MNAKNRHLSHFDWLLIAVFCASIFIGAPLLLLFGHVYPKKEREKQMDDLYGKLFFSGEVVGFHHINNPWKRPAAIMCIKIDSANVDSFYHFDKYTALMIRDGMATFPLGYYNPQARDSIYEKVIYVSVNSNGLHKMMFITDEKDTIIEDLYFTSSDLKECNLKICDDG